MNQLKKHLLFLTTSSLAANPRLVKEFESLKSEYKCIVVCFKHKNWSRNLSNSIKNRNPEVHFIEIDRKALFIQTIMCKLLHKTSILLNQLYRKNLTICSFASDEKALQIWINLKSLDNYECIYRVIGHNLGSFYAAVRFAKDKNVKLQLDIEDYHPGETFYFNKALEEQNRLLIMARSFLVADYVTYASTGIKLECEKAFKLKENTKTKTIINSFESNEFKKPVAINNRKIKCVWFSQNIGPNRGLKEVFEAAKHIQNSEFHIIGNPIESYLDRFKLTPNVIIHKIMEQNKLHIFLSEMDIGLALEPAKDLNNDIALSNKIIAYAQSGLYILATNTYGQSQFINSLQYEAGKILTTDLKKTLEEFNTDLLSSTQKIARWQKAKSICWTNEVMKLKQILE